MFQYQGCKLSSLLTLQGYLDHKHVHSQSTDEYVHLLWRFRFTMIVHALPWKQNWIHQYQVIRENISHYMVYLSLKIAILIRSISNASQCSNTYTSSKYLLHSKGKCKRARIPPVVLCVYIYIWTLYFLFHYFLFGT